MKQSFKNNKNHSSKTCNMMLHSVIHDDEDLVKENLRKTDNITETLNCK